MNNNPVDIKKYQKRNKKNNAVVDIFNDNKEETNDNSKTKAQEEEDNDDYNISGNIVNTDIAKANNQANVDIQKNIWEENNREPVVYDDVRVVVEKPDKKVAKWGDAVKQNKPTAAPIDEAELYFPDINNPNAEKQAPKPKAKPEAKNAHLFGDSSNFSRPQKDDRFTATNAIKFTNSKGEVDKLAKLQQVGPRYDANLEDDNLNNTEEPVKFKGKVSLLGQETDADRQRALFMKEINERQVTEVEKKKNVWNSGGADAKEETRFFNSKGASKLNGFMRQDNNEQEDNTGKRQFTNSKKVNAGFKAPELDPNVPTVSNNTAVTAKVTLKGWD